MYRRKTFANKESASHLTDGRYIDDKYAPLGRSETDNVENVRLEDLPIPIPYGKIIASIFMFITGTVLIVLSLAVLFGLLDEKFTDRVVPALIIGSIFFIPGTYYTYILICILFKVPGYSFNDYPRFN